jgi:hypothetical protein
VADLPDEVRSFLQAHIESVMQLEVLLHLRSLPDEAHDPAVLSRDLGGSVDAAIGCLAALERSRLVVRDDPAELAHRYAPADRSLVAAVDLLADTYAKRKVAVVTEIFSAPKDDLRSFSDAFRLRKDR